MHIYIYLHTYAYAYICTRTHIRMHDTVHTLKHWYWDHNLCTNMHTHTRTHVYKRIDVQIHTHMHIYINIHVRTHTHIHIYTHTHTKCTYERTQARLERRRGSERARSRCRERKLCTSLSFDAIRPHFAPPMQGLHCTHFLKHQYPSTPHPPSQHTPKQFADCGQAQFYCSTLIRWTEFIALKKLRAASQWPLA